MTVAILSPQWMFLFGPTCCAPRPAPSTPCLLATAPRPPVSLCTPTIAPSRHSPCFGAANCRPEKGDIQQIGGSYKQETSNDPHDPTAVYAPVLTSATKEGRNLTLRTASRGKRCPSRPGRVFASVLGHLEPAVSYLRC